LIYTAKATKFSIYLNTSPYLTAAQVKAKTGADIIFNGTWYAADENDNFICATPLISGGVRGAA
jgi:hypothetical protein